jgi:hypothetical protein
MERRERRFLWPAVIIAIILLGVVLVDPAGLPSLAPGGAGGSAGPQMPSNTPAADAMPASVAETAATPASKLPSAPASSASAPATVETGAPPVAVEGAEAMTHEPPKDANELLQAVGMVVRDYRLRFGGNPVGSNAEITAALARGNAGQVDFLTGRGLPVNEKGELVDPWGTALFFHQLSGDEMELRSAGPDRQLWTDDDLVGR